VELRHKEASDAAGVIGAQVRHNLRMADGFFRNDEEHQRRIIPYIRYYQPDIVVANAIADRHPDHSRAGRLIADACFYAGLRKIESEWEGQPQEPWRPKRVYHCIQDRHYEPTFIVDITDAFDSKYQAIRCYASQFHNPDSAEPISYIATEGFFEALMHKDGIMGKRIGVRYGEGFVSENVPGIGSLDDLLLPDMP
jgi:bacillithiol biosynthesis deacetylase BshB1